MTENGTTHLREALLKELARATDESILRIARYTFFSYKDEFIATPPEVDAVLNENAQQFLDQEKIDSVVLCREVLVNLVEFGDTDVLKRLDQASLNADQVQLAAVGTYLAISASCAIVILAVKLKSVTKDGLAFYKYDPKSDEIINKMLKVIFGK